jgi:hypothetical protein
VQDGVIKFFLEIFVRQELLGSGLEERVLQYLVDVGAQFWISHYQLAHQLLYFRRKNVWQRWHVPIDDLHGQHVNIGAVERRLETAHFKQKHAQTPNIAFEVVRFVRYNLRAQIVGRAHHSLSLVHSFVQHFGNAKVAKFDNSSLRQKYILCFQISVQDLAIVHMLHRQADLREPVQNLILRHVSTFFFLFFDFALEITSIGVIHNDAKLPLFGFIDFFEMYDIWMIQDLQYFGFFHGVDLLLRR